MKILYYCQHVLGIGHFHRSLEICRACSDAHQVTMIVGGPDIAAADQPFDFLKLPGLQMDDQFSRLQSCDPGLDLEEVKRRRVETLLSFYRTAAPDCLILELYPFGRKAFRFELIPCWKPPGRTPPWSSAACAISWSRRKRTGGCTRTGSSPP